MPELPEVETIRRGLSKRLVGRTIRNIEVRNVRSFQGEVKDVIGANVSDIERRAKVIRIKLSNGLNLLFHLKMTGQLIYRQSAIGNPQSEQKRTAKSGQLIGNFAGGHPDHEWHAELPTKHTHIIFTFDDGSHLYFNDLRKFGWCKVLTADQIDDILVDYGLEPFSDDFTAEYMIQKAKKIPNRTIKQFLMDQEIIAGVGNIYADEALFDARILPTRKVKDIILSEWQKVHDSVLKVLDMGIKYGGTTDSDYVNSEGKKGGMQDHLKVYHKTGEKCSGGCGGVVKRMTIGGRGTHYCESCQK